MIDRQDGHRVSARKIPTSRHLEAISDLTVAASIKRGFVPAFESITYEGRLRLVMKALFRMRQTAREFEDLKPFADSAERIQSLRSFRLAVLPGDPSTLVLAATFDRAWEPYMRLIWDPLGPMLDVIFCNCEGYVPAFDNSFDDYVRWVREHQVDSDFFYATTGLSVSDLAYLSQAERLSRDLGPDAEADLVKLVAEDPFKAAEDVRKANKLNKMKADLLAVDVLKAFYRLADYYPVDELENHGKYLIRATRGLLGDDWDPEKLDEGLEGIKAKLAKEIAWYRTPTGKRALFTESHLPALSQVQTGILGPYDSDQSPITHGCLMLMQVTDPERARKYLGKLPISWEDGKDPTDGIFVNLAFTRRGLEEIGVPEDQLRKFPKEFEEGMEERAGLLGDVREHHPRRWRLPRRWNPDLLTAEPADPIVAEIVPPDGARRAVGLGVEARADLVSGREAKPPQRPPASSAEVELSEVDFVIQLRTRSSDPRHDVADDPGHSLGKKVAELAADPAATGVRLLAVESLRRVPSRSRETRDHFGFVDGISQPIPAGISLPPLKGRPAIVGLPEGNESGDAISVGELLCGYANDRRDGPPQPDPYLDNGSYLVLRKLRQDKKELEEFLRSSERALRRQARAHAARTGANVDPPTKDELLGYMMGRDRSGTPVVGGKRLSNDFNYDHDAKGERCPLRAHIRRTNPRLPPFANRKGPRIMRRGMSYGPPFKTSADAERGLLFMCYNSSISEQYEVIQRWLNGANPTGLSSSQNDPLTGIGSPGDKRTFRFLHEGQVYRVPLDAAGHNRFVSLEWGMYLFAPSRAAVQLIAEGPPKALVVEQLERGKAIVDRLMRLEAEGKVQEAAFGWKTALEDFVSREPALQDDGPAIWAAIRHHHGGAIRVPYGDWKGGQPERVVLVASRKLVDRVFADEDQLYSVAEAGQARMPQCFGRIYIGRDADDPRYQAESAATNKAIMAIRESEAFETARIVADGVLAGTFDFLADVNFKTTNKRLRQGKIDLRDQFISPVLAQLCRMWFGLPDDRHPIERTLLPNPCVIEGGWDWTSADHRTPHCPGDFMAPSRYLFYPDPLPSVQRYGKVQGNRLHAEVLRHLDRLESHGGPKAKLTKAIYDDLKPDLSLVASNVIGIMTGLLPPTDGNLRLALFGWLEENDLWRIQQGLVASAAASPYERARAALKPALIRAMQRRPAPDMVLRTARKAHRLGDVPVEANERIFVGIIGATMDPETPRDDAYAIFGGNRRKQGHPTHACPGYEIAMGVMLGILTALFDRCRIRKLPAPLKVEIVDLAPTQAEATESDRRTDTVEGQPTPARG